MRRLASSRFPSTPVSKLLKSVGYAARHLSNQDLHLLGLLKGSLCLLSLRHFGLQLLAFFFELSSSFPDQLFQLSRPPLSI